MCNLSQEILQTGRREGMLEGRAEGRAEGELLRARQTAQNLRAMGMNVEFIAKAVSVPEETVKQWLEETTA